MTRLLLISIAVAACAHQAPTTTPAPSGTLTGSVHFVGTPCEQPAPGCDGPMTGYEVVVRSKDAKSIIATTKTDSTGHFAIALPAGEYTILTAAGMMKDDQQRTDVIVAAGGSIAVDLRVDTGVR
jgi:hypothetical protein